MPAKEVRWERMFPDQLEAAFAQCPLVYLSYGLCEPHGPINAVGLDSLKAHGIACRAAREHGGIVAPPEYWHIHELGGYASWAQTAVGNVPRTWLTAMPPWMHFKNICYHLRNVDAIGFHAAILLTGHYGPNWKDLKTLVELLQPHVGARLYGLPDFEANQPGFAGSGEDGDHAGKIETSLLWALEPDCVDMGRLPDRSDPGPHFALGDSAYDSDRDIGEQMVRDEVRWLGEKGKELLASYDELNPVCRMRTFTETEAIWKTVVAPALETFESLKPAPEEAPAIPDDSVWKANADVPGEDIYNWF